MADRADRRARVDAARLYLCTDSRRDRGDLVAFLHAVLSGGVDIVQLREKGLEAGAELELLAAMAAVAAEHGALVAVNDRADLAALSGADVLHVGQGDLRPAQARRLVGPEVLIGLSTHDRDQGDDAVADPDVDYYCVGPVWTTPTKPGRPAAPAGVVQAAAARPGPPWFAIGGIDSPGRLDEVLAAGAERIVVVRALTTAPDPRAAARELRGRLPA